mmetsp:Transcript_52866/g.140875  ORF Transcript_52866/g.140875 Transcript_52866/m.140875 type:complete len:243 (-) Transcript_52866:604-1332(-)
MDLRTSSTVSLWASRSSSILCSSSLMRRSESSCALWRDSLTACLWVLSSCSCASSDPFSSRIFPLSSRSWPSVLWTCSRYCLCASSRPSTSSRRSWRRRTSPSSWALRTPARWALDSPSSLDLATASSSSAAFFFASSRRRTCSAISSFAFSSSPRHCDSWAFRTSSWSSCCDLSSSRSLSARLSTASSWKARRHICSSRLVLSLPITSMRTCAAFLRILRWCSMRSFFFSCSAFHLYRISA